MCISNPVTRAIARIQDESRETREALQLVVVRSLEAIRDVVEDIEQRRRERNGIPYGPRAGS